MHNNDIIGKILTPVNRKKFKRIVNKYNGDFAIKKLKAWDQFIAIFLGQIGNNNSLRDIESVLKYHQSSHYHLGIGENIARSTLSDANNRRDWRIFRDVFYDLMENLKYQERNETQRLVELIDSSPIMLNLALHKWAESTMRIKGMKLHLVYDLYNNMPTYFEFSGAKTNDIEVGRRINIKRETTYVFDKGYTDYSWWYSIDSKGAYFVTRLKKDSSYYVKSSKIGKKPVLSDNIIQFKMTKQRKNSGYRKPLRQVIVEKEGKTPLVLVTNDMISTAEEIADLYRKRWQIELFFKWIKQNLKIKKFLGRSANAIKTQICISLITFVLLRLAQILGTLIHKIPLKTLITIVRNSLFTKLSIKKTGGKIKESTFKHKQIEFEFCFSP